MAGRRVGFWLATTGRFVENCEGEILGLGRRVRAPTGLRFGLGLGFWADVAGSSRPKSGMTIETPPMVMVTGCSLAVGGFVGAGLITGRGLIVLAVGGVRVFATDDARSFCWRFRGSNLSLFPISRPISKYVASGVGSLGREGVFRALSISFSSSSSSSSSRGGTKITFLSLPLSSLKVYLNLIRSI